jgi:hypothetical protein
MLYFNQIEGNDIFITNNNATQRVGRLNRFPQSTQKVAFCLGVKMDNDFRDKLGRFKKGGKFDLKFRKRLSEGHQGYVYKIKYNMGKDNYMYGKHHTEETKMKISLKLNKKIKKICIICNKDFFISPCRKNAKFCSVKCHSHYLSLTRKDKNNPAWKGDKVGLTALHNWVRRRLLKPKLCQECGKKPPYDLANKSGKYLRDLSDWEYLCRSCHMIKDGRLVKFNLFNSRRKNERAI